MGEGPQQRSEIFLGAQSTYDADGEFRPVFTGLERKLIEIDAVVAKVNTVLRRRFILNQVTADGFRIDYDAVGNAIGKTQQMARQAGSQITKGALARNDHGGAKQPGAWNGKQVHRHVEGVHDLNVVSLQIAPKLHGARESRRAIEGPHRKNRYGNAGSTQFRATEAFAHATDMRRKKVSIEGLGCFGKLAFAAAYAQFARQQQNRCRFRTSRISFHGSKNRATNELSATAPARTNR